MAKDRAALLVRCTREEADLIRNAARHERRTVSGFVLHAVMNRIANSVKLQQQFNLRSNPAANNVNRTTN
jgi:uncharacterized protein (DUF1778 family)